MPITANWSYPTAVKLGAGRIRELADHCKALGMKRPLLVTDRGLASMAITANALDILEAGGLGHLAQGDRELGALARPVGGDQRRLEPLRIAGFGEQGLGLGDIGLLRREFGVEAIGRAERRVVAGRAEALGDEIDHGGAIDSQGQRLAHSMDPRTQAPVRNEVASVTVLATSCMQADAWATALLVAGQRAGETLAQQQGLQARWVRCAPTALPHGRA